MKKFLLTACAAFALAACSDDAHYIPVTGLALDRTEAQMLPGQTLQLTATPTPSDAAGEIVWSSSDRTAATVSAEGLVAAAAPGTTVVTATCGGFSAACTIRVGEPAPEFETISFEPSEKMTGIDGAEVSLRTISVVSGTSTATFPDVYWAKEYTEANDMRDKYDQLFFASPLFSNAGGDVWFSSYYCDCTIYGAQYDAWGGFVLSSNANKASADGTGIHNQFEAYVDGGAGGSKVFAVCYDAKTAGMAMSADCCWPQIDFTGDEGREVISLALANSTWTYNYFGGAAGDSYAVRIKGTLKGKDKGVVECTLIDGAVKADTWKTVDLSSLGKVDCLAFSVVSSDRNAPLYFCVDDIILK